jgi:hypothetical protein
VHADAGRDDSLAVLVPFGVAGTLSRHSTSIAHSGVCARVVLAVGGCRGLRSLELQAWDFLEDAVIRDKRYGEVHSRCGDPEVGVVLRLCQCVTRAPALRSQSGTTLRQFRARPDNFRVTDECREPCTPSHSPPGDQRARLDFHHSLEADEPLASGDDGSYSAVS